VTATQDDSTPAPTSDRTFVIVGAGLAGAKAAETLREEGFDGRVVLVGEEDETPYERPPLSKAYLLGSAKREEAQVHPADWYEQQRIELRTGVRAEALDPAAHTVRLAGGETIRYDKLLLATGSVPRRLDVPGADLAGVYTLRRATDADALREVLVEGARVVVIGGGWIGLEVAAAARTHGAHVTLVETEPLPLRRVLGDELGRVFAGLHAEHEVDLRLGSGVREIVAREGGAPGQVASVVLSDGSTVPADVVVVGVGVRPTVELAEQAGLEVGDGVLVDSSLRTSDPDVYAAGDLAASVNPLLGERVRVEHWANALNGGPAAAKAMLGQAVTYDPVPYFFTDQYDLGMEYAGYVPRDTETTLVVRGDLATREFVAFWLAGGKLLAGINVNVWDVSDDIQRIIRAGTPVDPAKLADPDVPLSEL
jgi:3-phenylpropionate/trans-cinnamate dioxygenase ferredoxin reductase subunit